MSKIIQSKKNQLKSACITTKNLNQNTSTLRVKHGRNDSALDRVNVNKLGFFRSPIQ